MVAPPTLPGVGNGEAFHQGSRAVAINVGKIVPYEANSVLRSLAAMFCPSDLRTYHCGASSECAHVSITEVNREDTGGMRRPPSKGVGAAHQCPLE